MRAVLIRRYRPGVWAFMCGSTPRGADVDFWCADAMRIFPTQQAALAFGLEHATHHDSTTGQLVPTVPALLHLASAPSATTEPRRPQ